MSVSPDGEEVASYSFTTLKNDRDFIYEMKLIHYKPTNEFCFMRRWHYSDKESSSLWRDKGWSKEQEREFDRKLVQKRDIMKMRVVKSKDIREK